MDNQPPPASPQPASPPFVPSSPPPPIVKASTSFFKRFKIGRFGIFALLIAAIPVVVGAAQFVTDNRQQAAGSGPTISGIVFIDTNGNGKKDTDELPYTQTMPVNLRVQGGNDKKTFTDQNGVYMFDNLKLDTNYTVRFEILPSGYTRTTPVKQMQLGQNNRKKTFDVGIASGVQPPPGATATPTPTPGGSTGRSVTCSPTELVLKREEQQVTATFRNASGETVRGRKILWRSSLSDNQINILNPSSETDANGVVRTRVRARDQKFVGKTGTITAVFDNDRNIKCTITLLSGQGGPGEPTATPTPTDTPGDEEPTATPTPISGDPGPGDPGPLEPGEVRLQLAVFLDGIGKAGDKQNREDTSLGNNNPQEKEKEFTVQLVKDLGRGNYEVMQQAATILTFDATTGNYKGAVDFTNVPQGEVHINFKTKRHVTLLSEKETVTPGQATDTAAVYMLAGDASYDGVTTIADYNILYGCFADFNPVPRDCDDARKDASDFTDDGKVDSFDLSLFQRDYIGQDQSPID